MSVSTSARSGLTCTSPPTGIRLISKSIAHLSVGSLDRVVAPAAAADALRRGGTAVVERGRVGLRRRGRALLLVDVRSRRASLVGQRQRPLAVERVQSLAQRGGGAATGCGL